MITNDHLQSFTRLRKYCHPDMLMLGRQTNTSSFRFPCEYKTLDLDGGDYECNLGEPLWRKRDGVTLASPFRILEEHFETVFNLGTLEHVWDAHQAYVNAASMVRLGGHFIGQSPVAGWEGHGIHVTDYKMIQAFFIGNGFRIEDAWCTTQAGNDCDAPKRNGGKSVLYWFVARRVQLNAEWKKPSQVYTNGVKPS